MPLLSLWNSNPIAVAEFTVGQVVSSAGDGNLTDGSICSRELQNYLSQITSEKLEEYVGQCLTTRFEKGGMVLQDLINEFGRRLDYKVTNGRYQGNVHAIGYDEIWISPEKHAIVVEVKTTDAYRISLDTLARYRQKLSEAGTVTNESSILIVVGRQDTGELEAQIRGSRHAWDIRLISAEALIKLVKLKENSDDPETGQKIRGVLAPVEYTRLDRLVDVMFTTAADTGPAVAANEKPPSEVTVAVEYQGRAEGTWEFTDAVLLQQKRELIIKSASSFLGKKFIKKSRALYWSPDHTDRVACTISKRYTKKGAYPYWYAYHPTWEEFLKEGASGHLILGCMDLPTAFVIPRQIISEVLSDLNTTEIEGGNTYWHLHVVEQKEKYELLLPKSTGNLSLTAYAMPLSEQASSR